MGAPDPAKKAVFVTVINKRDALASVPRSDIYIVSLDRNYPNDAKRAKVARSLDPEKLSDRLAALGLSKIAASEYQNAFHGGAISPGGFLSGLVFFGNIDGIRPRLMCPIHGPQKDVVSIPLGSGA